jgi:hypothetical protein
LNTNCDSITESQKYKESLNSATKDDCAVLNDHMFGQYHLTQKKVLAQVEENARSSITKRLQKEKRLKQFV